MKTAALAVFLCLFAVRSLPADIVPPPPPPPSQPTAAPLSDHRLPGIGLAEFITQTTGVAFSPLLGVSGVGAWKWWHTPEDQRAGLPWYCQPWAWGTAFGLLALCFLKDFLGTAAPPLVKKPLDFAELFENKASAIVASAAFVPMLAAAAATVDAVPSQAAAAGATPAAMGLASAPALGFITDLSWFQLALYLPLGLSIFAVVWLAGHAINVLIALSPFGIVDSGLKLLKLGLVATVTIAAMIHPLLGLVVCLPLILIAALVSGWAFRLTVFGTVFGCDFLLARKARAEEWREGVKSFNARKFEGVPVRTYGELHTDEKGAQVFRHRPWLIFPARETLVPGPLDGLTKGMIHPTITRRDASGRPQAAFILPPRFRNHVEEISRRFGIQDIADSTLLRGLKAMRNWLVEMLSVGRNLVERGVAQGQRALQRPGAP